MIAQIYNETSDHKFILKVTDAKGKSTTKTLTCHLTGKAALAYNNDADLWAIPRPLRLRMFPMAAACSIA